MKKAVRKRDGYRCTRCGMPNAEHVVRYGSQLQVHRVVPGSVYSEAPGVCVTVCVPCHGPMPRRKSGQRLKEEPWCCQTLRLDPALAAPIAEYRAAFRREHDVRLSVAAVVEQALRKLFREAGILPPEEGDPTP